MKLILRVWFYDPADDRHGIVNKAVSALNGRFCHCEVQVKSGVACSIYMGGSVQARQRTFESPAYSCLEVPCSQPAHSAVERVIAQACAAPQAFSMVGMLGAHCKRDWCPEGSTFCSTLCVELLKAGGVLDASVNGSTVSPNDLHEMLAARFQPRVSAAPEQGGKVAAIGFRV